jgi:hypothetical protein
MTDRLTDDQIRQALARRSPAHSPEDLRMHILSTAAQTGQVPLRRPWRLSMGQPAMRLAYFAALLGLLAIVAFAGLTGGGSHGLLLTAQPTASPTAKPTAPSSPAPSATPVRSAGAPSVAPAASDRQKAVAAVTSYEQALADGDFRTAWNLLAAPSRFGESLESFTAERSAFLDSSKGWFQLKAPDNNRANIEQWLARGVTDGVDVERAYVIEVDFPALAGNNAGYEIFLVSPDAAGAWHLWVVR